MAGNQSANPSFTMIPQSQTLTLTLVLSLFFSSASSSLTPSPSPAPSPFQTIMSHPIGVLRHPPPPPEILHHRSPPPLCPPNRIDCLESHRDHHHAKRRATPVNNENGKLNFGKKIGIVFAAAAILLQVVLGVFLVYKRIQLKKLDKGSRLVSASDSS